MENYILGIGGLVLMLIGALTIPGGIKPNGGRRVAKGVVLVIVGAVIGLIGGLFHFIG